MHWLFLENSEPVFFIAFIRALSEMVGGSQVVWLSKQQRVKLRPSRSLWMIIYAIINELCNLCNC